MPRQRFGIRSGEVTHIFSLGEQPQTLLFEGPRRYAHIHQGSGSARAKPVDVDGKKLMVTRSRSGFVAFEVGTNYPSLKAIMVNGAVHPATEPIPLGREVGFIKQVGPKSYVELCLGTVVPLEA